jgi:aspartyl-tRNA(Asn)/glutamyl-tRNA(Gln) amidotransferase subunit B
LVLGGSLLGVRIRRIHLEEDVGRSQHSREGTLIDFNRSSIPLMELVTEPDIRSADEATAFARELQLICRYLDVSNADMEKGNMRIEANISLNMGTKVECKNINSFKAVFDAVEYEISRQTELLKKGEKIVQETRGWNESKKQTVSHRLKEDAHDYRYFPEPDLPPFETAVFNIDDLKRHLSELPAAKRKRLKKEFGLSDTQAELLIADKHLADFFEAAVSELAAFDEIEKAVTSRKSLDLLFNYLTSDLKGLANEFKIEFADLKITPERLAHLVDLIDGGKIGSRQAKDILRKMTEEDIDPEKIMTKEGLETISDDGELIKIIDEVIDENSQAVTDYKKGKTASLQFLIGKAMSKLRGRGAPEALKKIFEEKL